MIYRVFFAIFSFIGILEALQFQSLNGKWKLCSSNMTIKDLDVDVPGGIYSDLMKNNILGDILHGYADETSRWVARTEWIYETTFTISEDLVNHERVNVVFDGLDTFADILVNDQKVGESKNMFVQYVFDIKEHLKVGENKIGVHFKSPIDVSYDLAEKQNQSYVVPPLCPPDVYHGECHANMARKMQASYSWDWGPAFPSVGIWKNVAIEAFNSSVIRHVVTDVEDKGSNWLLHVDVYLAGNKAKETLTGNLKVALKIADKKSIKKNVSVSVDAGNPVVSTELIVAKSKVITWWPNGYGDQKLYSLEVKYTNGDEENIKAVSVGFRTIELVQEPVGKGLSYYFKVNNVPIFMKGSNQIPIHILPELGQDKDKIRRLFQTAKDSHMNMLRVWGGGVYESDYFYDVADEMGILIWQDFMFACALYPANEDFLNNVLEEVDYQVKRLSGHASIALFAGNNENESALRDNWFGISNFTLYKDDYVKLYVDTVKRKLEEITHQRRIYITSSPSDGKQTELEGFVAKNPSDQQFGDVHFYDYTIDPLNSSAYPLPRFGSEYGYESFPSLDSWKEVVESDSDLNINGSFFEHRQHHPSGNKEMLVMINREFRPLLETDEKYTEAIIYFSQVIQALGTKTETERYRLHRSILDEEGRGHTMGALYWQINDVWVGPSWGSVDYTGRWKILQYHVKDFLAPVIITGYIDTKNQLQVYVVSDLMDKLSSSTAVIRVFKYNSFTPASENKIPVDMDAGSSKLINTVDINSLLGSANCGSDPDAVKNCFIHLSLVDQSGRQITPSNYVFPAKIRDSSLQNPNVKISSVKKEAGENVYSIELTADNVALFVTLDSHKIRGTFSENGFVLVEGGKTVLFYSETNTSAEDLSKELTVVSVFDYTKQD